MTDKGMRLLREVRAWINERCGEGDEMELLGRIDVHLANPSVTPTASAVEIDPTLVPRLVAMLPDDPMQELCDKDLTIVQTIEIIRSIDRARFGGEE